MSNLIIIDRQHLLNTLTEAEICAQISTLRQLVTACQTDIKALEQYLIENTQVFEETAKALEKVMPKKTSEKQHKAA